jgi:hypothetical protein
MIRLTMGRRSATWLAAALVAAPAADAGAASRPDAEIFAANTTEIITDLDDPRLDARLVGSSGP